jgi:hypothetical protein
MFVTVFTSARHWSLFSARLIQAISQTSVLWRNNIFLSTPMSSACLLVFRFYDKNFVRISNFPHACYMPHTVHPPWLDHSNKICVVYKLWSFSSWSLLQLPATSSLLCPNILLSTLFSNTLNLCSPLTVRDRLSYPSKQQVKLVAIFFYLSY